MVTERSHRRQAERAHPRTLGARSEQRGRCFRVGPTSFNDPSSEAGKETCPVMTAARTVLEAPQIARVLTRIAHEVIEHNKGADNLVLLGIPTRGLGPSERLAARIAEVEGAEVPVGALDVTM